MTNEEGVFLQFKPDELYDQVDVLACKACHCSSFRLVCGAKNSFPMMQCVGCGADIGQVGWAYDGDEPPEGDGDEEDEELKVA